MAEPVDPPRHRPKPDAIPPLPRLWKATPEPEEEDPAPRKAGKKKGGADAVDGKKGKGKKKPIDPVEDDGTGVTKLAETPVLDTYEARQKARWIIGGVLGSVGLVALILVVRAFRGGEAEPKEIVEPRDTHTAEVRARSEQEARALIEIARQADKLGKTQAALDTLGKVAKNYQGTPSARLAMESIDRNRRKRSLFGTDGEDQPTGPKPPETTPKVATAPAPTSPATPASPIGPTPGIPTAVAPSPPPESTGPTAPRADGSKGPEVAVRARPLPIGFSALPTTPLHASGWPTEIVADRDGAAMILIPATTFIMGREDGDPAERPSHRVTVSTFYIDRHEVTGAQFQQFLKDTGRPVDAQRQPDLPATGMSAREAKSYCEWVRRRLPTEAQWELAARSTDGRISYWNGEIPGGKDTPKGLRAIEPVMSLSTDVSPYGVFDLGANAWEFTSEWYDSQYYQQVKNGVTDPTGPVASRAKPAQVTVKGGSKSGVLTWRDGVRLEARLPYLGFRGALPVEGALIAPPSATVNPTGPAALPGGVAPF